MKKTSLCLLTLTLCISLSSCKTKIAPQNPNIKLSDEHSKMINLITNLAQTYGKWNIDFDTSSDNYIIKANYEKDDPQKLNNIYIYHLQYCNNTITDITTYSYENNQTVKYDSATHIRWNTSNITVTHGTSSKYTYSLMNQNELKANQTSHFLLAYHIQKIDDDLYLYEKFFPTSANKMLEGPNDGVNYLKFMDIGGYNIMHILNKKQEMYKIYRNGRLAADYADNQYYMIDDEGEVSGEYIYKNKEGEAITLPISRKYDDAGHLIYEEGCFNNGQKYVYRITKSIPDIKEFDPSLTVQIDLENAPIFKF